MKWNIYIIKQSRYNVFISQPYPLIYQFNMKNIIAIIFLFLFSTVTFAQISVVSTMPANGAYAVNTDSIVIVFDKKVPIETNSLEDLDFFFIEPEDSVQITSAKLSSDGLKATIYLNLKENTDYIAGIQGIRDDNGETADYLYIFQFTTAPTLGEFTVEGNLVSDDLPALKAELDSQIVVA